MGRNRHTTVYDDNVFHFIQLQPHMFCLRDHCVKQLNLHTRKVWKTTKQNMFTWQRSMPVKGEIGGLCQRGILNTEVVILNMSCTYADQSFLCEFAHYGCNFDYGLRSFFVDDVNIRFFENTLKNGYVFFFQSSRNQDSNSLV